MSYAIKTAAGWYCPDGSTTRWPFLAARWKHEAPAIHARDMLAGHYDNPEVRRMK